MRRSHVGRTTIQQALGRRPLTPATAELPPLSTVRSPSITSPLPDNAEILAVNRISAAGEDGRRLSDHDAYTVDVARI